MSEAKRAQLIEEGKLNPDGTRIEHPAPTGEDDAVGEAEVAEAKGGIPQ